MHPQSAHRPADAAVDRAVAFLSAAFGSNYGFRLVKDAVLALLPAGSRLSDRQLLSSMHRVDPAAFAARRRQAYRKLHRRVVFAPWTGFRWEVDYNEKLAYVGIHVGGGWDSCPRLWVFLRAVDNKLPYTQWTCMTMPAAQLHGFADQLADNR